MCEHELRGVRIVHSPRIQGFLLVCGHRFRLQPVHQPTRQFALEIRLNVRKSSRGEARLAPAKTM